MWCFSCRCLILFLERWLFRDASQVTTETLGELCEAALLKTLPKPRSLEMTLKPPAQRCKAMMCARTMGREFTTSVWSKLKAKKTERFQKEPPRLRSACRCFALTTLGYDTVALRNESKSVCFPKLSSDLSRGLKPKIEMRSLSGTQMSKAPSTRMTSQPACAS